MSNRFVASQSTVLSQCLVMLAQQGRIIAVDKGVALTQLCSLPKQFLCPRQSGAHGMSHACNTLESRSVLLNRVNCSPQWE